MEVVAGRSLGSGAFVMVWSGLAQAGPERDSGVEAKAAQWEERCSDVWRYSSICLHSALLTGTSKQQSGQKGGTKGSGVHS